MLISSLTQRAEPIEDGREFIGREFANWGVEMCGDGLLDIGYGLGMWEWLTVEQTREKFPDSPWLDVHCGCPLVGPTVGYLFVEYVSGMHNAWVSLLPPLLKEGRGIVASTITDEFHLAVTKRRLSLDRVIGKYVLDDGAMLLEREWGPYQDAVAAEFKRALAATGWDGYLPMGWMSSAHNSWRWSPGAAGFETDLEVMERFGHIEVDLWLYDFDAESLIIIPDQAA